MSKFRFMLCLNTRWKHASSHKRVWLEAIEYRLSCFKVETLRNVRLAMPNVYSKMHLVE